MKSNLPSYMRISPDAAMKDIDAPHPVSTLADMGQAFRNGRDALSDGKAVSPPRPPLRLFSIWEITTYLIPVAPAHFRRVLRANPDLPQGQSGTESGARWFSMDEIMQLRSHFAAGGSKAKRYLPYRPGTLPAKTVAVANTRAHTGKTTSCAHLAMAAAMDGYRVLAIDLDPQAHLTNILKTEAILDGETVLTLFARHYGIAQRSENQRRMDRGDPPLPLDPHIADALKLHSTDIVRPTRWPNIDLIAAGLPLCRADMLIPGWRLQSRSWKFWNALSAGLIEDEVLTRYDLVFLDTPPSLGPLNIAGLAAADILLVPFGATPADFAATGQFLDMLHSAFSAIEDQENAAARALGTEEMSFQWDAIRMMLTRFDRAEQTEAAARMATLLGRSLFPARQDDSAFIGPDHAAGSVYEVDYRDFNRDAYVQARTSFDESYAAFKKLLQGLWRRDELAAS